MIELEKYFTDILDNKIIACDKIKQASEMILSDFYSPNEYHFDAELAAHHTGFIEKFLMLPDSDKPFKLELFQKARLQTIFGFVDDNNFRKYIEALIMEGRKNGKTSETAAVELDMLCNDKESAPQIYNIATAKDQANLGFNAVLRMYHKSPMLQKHLKKRACDIYNPHNLGYIKSLANNTNSLDGLNIHCAIIDELSAVKNRDIYDLIKQATASRNQPLIFTISTNGFLRNGVFDSQYEYASKVLNGEIKDKRFLPLIYELNNPSQWDKKKFWIMANPGLGTVKKVKTLDGFVEKAKADPAFKPTVLVKDFNIKQSKETAWLTYEQAESRTKFDISEFDYCIGGIDAADSIDLNAAKAICMRPNDNNIYVKSMYWIPKSKLTTQDTGRRTNADNVPYELWEQQGFIRIVDGNRVDKRVFLEWFLELRDKELYTTYIGYDPWHISDELLRDFKSNFGAESMIPIRQGVATLSQPMKDLASEFDGHRIIYNDNPIDLWCLLNTGVKTDINANIQPIKASAPTQRIDGTAALLDAYVVLQNKKDMYINLNKEEIKK